MLVPRMSVGRALRPPEKSVKEKKQKQKQKPGLCKNQNSVMAHEFANITMKNQYKNFDLP